MDQALAEMAKAAEGGSWCPQLRILAGNTLFVGTPTSSGRFLDATEHRVAEDYWNTKRPGTSEKEAWYAESVDYAQRAMATVRQVTGGDGGGDNTLTLADAQVWPASGGDGVQVPAARVPLDSIDGWWIGGGKRLRAGGGGGWFFGAIVPID